MRGRAGLNLEYLKHYLEEAYLPGARWWPWKGLQKRVEVVDWDAAGDIVLLILRAEGLLFHLPLIKVKEVPRDFERGFCIEGECYVEGEYSKYYFAALRNLGKARVEVVGDLGYFEVEDAQPLTLESTNAVVEYKTNRGSLVLKSYRLIPEVDLEVRVLRRLASKNYEHMPRVYAFIHYSSYVTGILMSRVKGEQDGGAPFYESLCKYLSGDTRAERIGLASKLGVIIGKMHVALNSEPDGFFGVEPVTSSDIDSWASRIERMFRNALRRLDSAIDAALGKDRAELEYWRDFAEKKGSSIVQDATSQLEFSKELYKGRIHQDLHLAQMIYTGDGIVDFVVTDFEGEPGRTLQERLLKEPLIRDLATMIRSFHYLSHAAIMNTKHVERHKASELMLKGDPSLAWRARHVLAMVYSYLARMLGTGLLGKDEYRVASSVWKYLYPWIAERAVYEFYYEAHYRPPWVSIPLVGLAEAPVYKSFERLLKH